MTSQDNLYALVHPINSLRVTLELLQQHGIKTDVRLKAVCHAKAINNYKETKSEIDADLSVDTQATLTFLGKNWVKPYKIIDGLNKAQILDVPIQQIELILPSTYDGKRHHTTFRLLNIHSNMFAKMATKGRIPYKRLMGIHKKFLNRLKETNPKNIYQYLRRSVLIMVDVNPGKDEMYNKEFVIGLKQPFMQKVVSTEYLWKCTDYEMF